MKKSSLIDPISINIFNESSHQYIPRQRVITTLEQLLFIENFERASVNVIVLDNDGIQKINKQYLGHDYPTDVISFIIDEKPFEAEVYISVEMAKHNAEDLNTNWREEMLRYAIHGVLHTIGYNDSTDEEKKKMNYLENKYLALD